MLRNTSQNCLTSGRHEGCAPILGHLPCGPARLGWSIQLGFLAAAGRHSDHLGTIVLGSAALSGSLDVLVWNPISLRLAGDAGLAWASAISTDETSYGQDAVTPHLAVHFDLTVRLLHVGSVALELGGSAGYATGLIAKAGDRQVASIAGLFAGALVGVHLPL